MVRPILQKLKREMRQLTDNMTQMDLIDIYRTFPPNTKEYTFYTATHGTFFKIDHILENKAKLNRYKNNWRNPLYLIRSPWFKVRIQ